MSHFAFLQLEWPDLHEAASKAEAIGCSDPRTACFYARRALEIAVMWVFKHDPGMRLPYQDNVSALIHEPTFKQAAGDAVFNKAKVIVTLGNRAVHGLSVDSGKRCAGGGAGAVSCLLLAGADVCSASAAGCGVGV